MDLTFFVHGLGGGDGGLLDRWLCFCQKCTGIRRLSVVSGRLVSIGLAFIFSVSAPVARATR